MAPRRAAGRAGGLRAVPPCLLLLPALAGWAPPLGGALARGAAPERLAAAAARGACPGRPRCRGPARAQGFAQGAAAGGPAPGGATALLPVGPFCPFRSAFCADGGVNAEMGELSERAAVTFREFAPVSLEIQMGKVPDPKVVKPFLEKLSETNELWKVALGRMRLSEDFQAREFFKLMEKQSGMPLENMQAMLQWQLDGMRAFCEGGAPPPMPPGITEEMLLARARASSGPLPAMATITAQMFTPDSKAMQSEVVKAELDLLVKDHKALVKMGETYGSFDPAGKAIFLDQVEAVESRWEVFISRFQLMGELNPDYVQQANSFLESSGLSVAGFRQLLREAHTAMRQDAEREALGG